MHLSLALLSAGRFREGWREYEWRSKGSRGKLPLRGFQEPQWRGQDIRGKTLLLHAEQGFGDTLQFCRYAPMAALKARVILEVPQPLLRLCESLRGIDRVIALGEALPSFDVHCPLMSLPLAFETMLATIPAAVSLTWVDVRSEQEADQVKLTAAAIAAEMTSEPGFIGWLGVEIGSRLYTITAWDDADAVNALMRSTTHKEAVRQFFNEDLGAAAATGVWRVHHLNPARVRCLSCGQMTNPAAANGRCYCGRPVPESPPYW